MGNDIGGSRIKPLDEPVQVDVYMKRLARHLLWRILQPLLRQAEIALWNLLSPCEDEESPLLNKVAEAFFVMVELSPGASRSLSYGDEVSPAAMTSILHLISVTGLMQLGRLFHILLKPLLKAQCL